MCVCGSNVNSIREKLWFGLNLTAVTARDGATLYTVLYTETADKSEEPSDD